MEAETPRRRRGREAKGRTRTRILDHLRATGSPVTMGALVRELGFDRTTLWEHLNALRHSELVQRNAETRTWELTERVPTSAKRAPAVEIPVYGRIAAGTACLATSEVERMISVDASLLESSQGFAVTVKGDSMIDAHILDGDLAIVDPRREAKSGDVVAALILDPFSGECEGMIKTLRRDGRKVFLYPANDNYPRIDFGKGKVAGVVVGLFRTGITASVRRR